MSVVHVANITPACVKVSDVMPASLLALLQKAEHAGQETACMILICTSIWALKRHQVRSSTNRPPMWSRRAALAATALLQPPAVSAAKRALPAWKSRLSTASRRAASPLATLPEAHNPGRARCEDHILKHAQRRKLGSQLGESGHRPRGAGRQRRRGRLRLARATDCLQSTPSVPANRPPSNTTQQSALSAKELVGCAHQTLSLH